MSFVSILEAGRLDFLEAVRSAPAGRRASADAGWTVLECIEHVIAVERRYLDWLADGTATATQRRPERELQLLGMIRSRGTKVEAPAVFQPVGRFKTLDAAVAEFQTVRDRSVRTARDVGEGLYSISVRHPRFGGVNGAELMQLMDGHARRHADQIREMDEEVQAVKRPQKAKKNDPLERERPDLPAEFEAGTAEDLVPDGGEIWLQGRRVEDLEWTSGKVSAMRMEGCILERVRLAGSEFGSVTWKDVRLVGCDLANVKAHRINLVRVELVDCRLTGFAARAAEWQDVLVRNGDGRFAQLLGGVFRRCEFDGGDWQEADFREADLSGAVLRGCQLGRADLRQARLRGTDFRKSELEEMLVGVGDLDGAIVDPAQAMVLARLMGLQIR